MAPINVLACIYMAILSLGNMQQCIKTLKAAYTLPRYTVALRVSRNYIFLRPPYTRQHCCRQLLPATMLPVAGNNVASCMIVILPCCMLPRLDRPLFYSRQHAAGNSCWQQCCLVHVGLKVAYLNGQNPELFYDLFFSSPTSLAF